MKLGAALCVLACAALQVSAQANSTDDFEALSRRATAALESNPAEAAKLYRQAVTIRPSWAEGWFYLGASLYETRQYGESQKAFERAAKLAAENGTVWAFLGLCEYQMGAYAQSLADIRKGEGLGLGDNKQFISSIRNHAALIYLRQSEFGSAMEQLQPLARIGDDSPATIEALGVSALGLPEVPPEIPADQKGLVQLAGRAAWALSAQHAEQTGTLFQELVARYPKEPGVHYFHGLYLMESDPGAALTEFRREIQIRPSHVPAHLQAAILEIKAGSPKTAVELARDAIKLQPSNGYCHMTLGRAYLSLGEIDKATAALEAAVKLAPQNPQPHFYLEQAYRQAGRTADAQREKAEFSRLKAKQDPLVLPDYTKTSVNDSAASGPLR